MSSRPRVIRAQTRDVRLRGLSGRGTSFAAFVALPEGRGEIRVRYTAPELRRGTPWKCDTHGPQNTPECSHTRAVAAVFTTYQENHP